MKKPIYWILIAIFGIIFIVSGFIVGRYLLESRNSKQLQQELIDMRPTNSTISIPGSTSTQSTSSGTPSSSSQTTESSSTTPPEPVILEDLQAAYERNNHLIGWIYIPGTENKSQNFAGINYPVLQSPNESGWHNFYLNHDFDRNLTGDGKEDMGHGWIYVRESCDVFAPCDNIVIYGHNMADGTMFGQLVNYRFQDYYEAHKYIYFDTLYERRAYEIVAVFTTSGETGVGYTYHSRNNFTDEADFNEFMYSIKGGAPNVYIYYNIDATAQYGDQLITLSTCWTGVFEEGRMVIVAKCVATE